MTIHFEIIGSPTLRVHPSRNPSTTRSLFPRIPPSVSRGGERRKSGGRTWSVIVWIAGKLEEMFEAMRRRVDSEGSSVRLKGVGKVLTKPGRGRKGRVHKFKRFRRTGFSRRQEGGIPKLETMNSLNRVTVVSLILGPKRFRKVVLED
jgi:hypothetical protein